MKELKRQIIIAVVIGVLSAIAIFASNKASAAEVEMPQFTDLNQCMNSTFWKSIGGGAAYGGAVGALGGVAVVAMSPAGTFTAAVGATVIGLNALSGALLGSGATAVSMIVMDDIHNDYLAELCRIAIAHQVVDQATAAGTSAANEAGEIARSLLERFKQ